MVSRFCGVFFYLLLMVVYPVNAKGNLLFDSLDATISTQKYLSAEKAFSISTSQIKDELSVTLTPVSGYFLYKKSIAVETANAEMEPFSLPEGKTFNNGELGIVHVYDAPISFKIKLKNIKAFATARIHYQGCTAGVCYTPQLKTISLTIPTGSTSLSDTSILSLLGFLLIGIGLSLTPCVYPMYPVLSAMITQQGTSLSPLRGFGLSLIYVLGMATTYTVLGLAVAIMGARVQGWIQSPWLLGLFSVFYVMLAIQMYLGRRVGLPDAWVIRLNQIADKQVLSSKKGIALLGALSGLIGSPCTSAPLSGVLLYIAHSGNPLYGALTLFVLSLGMGLPLLLIGVLGGKYLPKSGRWMDVFKQTFALLLLTMPLFLLERLLSDRVANLLWLVYVVVVVVWLVKSFLPVGWRFKSKIAFFVVMAFSAGILIAYLFVGASVEQSNSFSVVSSRSELNQILTQSKVSRLPVILDFYASWCVACRELDEKTFNDLNVKTLLKKYQLVRIDVTQNTAEHQALMREYNVIGLPHVSLISDDGIRANGIIQGFVPAKDLLTKLQSCDLTVHC